MDCVWRVKIPEGLKFVAFVDEPETSVSVASSFEEVTWTLLICDPACVAFPETLLATSGSDDSAVTLSSCDADGDNMTELEGPLVWAADCDDVATETPIVTVDV